MNDGPLSLVAGWRAAREGLPVSDCPVSAGDPTGAAWRKGWLLFSVVVRDHTGIDLPVGTE